MIQCDERGAGRYRARDIVRVPTLISLLRIPLAVLFVFMLDRPWAALIVLVAAASSDLLDGWYARKFGLASTTGAAVDAITDKFFAATVAITLVLHARLSVAEALLLNVREFGEILLFVWILFSNRARFRHMEHATSNVSGKLTTACQFGAVGSALFDLPQTKAWVAAAAVIGVIAATTYWRREWRMSTRAESSAPKADAGA